MSSSSGCVVMNNRRDRVIAMLAVGARIRILLEDTRGMRISTRDWCRDVAEIIGYAWMLIPIGILHGAI